MTTQNDKMNSLPQIFITLCDRFKFNSQADLFVTRLSKQIDKYVSWMLDPYCIAGNGFNFSWKPHKIYAFPPFSLVGATILKLIRDNTIGIMIIPKWTMQYSPVPNNRGWGLNKMGCPTNNLNINERECPNKSGV